MTTNEEKIENPNPVMYVVVSGEYSDYSIVSLWSSKQAAKDECELLNGSGMGYDFRVEEWLLNVSTLDGARREVEGYTGVLYLNDVAGEVTAAEIKMRRDTFRGEFEDRSFHYKGNKKYPPHVSAYSATEEGVVALVLEKLAEVRGESREANS
jgi:hypothetical protein